MKKAFRFGGFAGKVLRVDLTSLDVRSDPLKEEYVKKFLGGRGLAAAMIFDELRAGISPLCPENKLIFTTGPFTGTGIPGTSRFILATKSPLTGIYAYSVAGGHFGFSLKRSGYDAIVIEGESREPVYLFIDKGEASIKDASWLWGTTVFEATRLLKEAIGYDIAIATIGPAGERNVKFAAVITDDRRAAARGGAGAVMGSKKLKAVVVRGKQEPIIVNREEFFRGLKHVHKNLMKQPGPWREFPETGTQSGPRKNDAWGILPTRNWQEATFKGAMQISHPYIREKFVIKDKGCPGCPIKCTKVTLVKDGPYAGAITDGPEYETLYAFGSACGVDRPEAIIAADMLCDNFGLDTISTGVTIAWAMECFEKGILSLKDTDGIQLCFGNHKAMVKAVKRIAYKKGNLGQLLALGSREASQKIGKGSERYAMQVKGLEMGGYDPRGSRGMALVFACGPRGGCHHAYGVTSFVEIPNGSALLSGGKGKLVHQTATLRILLDTLPICAFMASAVPIQLLATLTSAITGINFSAESLMEIAERTMTVERAFNAREGLNEKDDTLPERLFTEPLPSGPNKGQVITREEFKLMKKEFYESVGWDINNGLPTRAKLESLGLRHVADQLVDLGIH